MAVIFIVQGRSVYERRAALIISDKSISSQIDSLNKSLAWAESFQTHRPQALLDCYQEFLNNLHLIANANQASILIRSKDLSPDKNNIKVFVKESAYSGVSQIDLEITVSHLTNSSKLAAIFDGFSDLEKNTPVVIEGFYQEKDYLVFNVSVLGV
jgi:hypothetical protein